VPAKTLLRRVPGLVAGKRAAVGAYRLVRPLRPPVESPSLVTRMLVTSHEGDFITGNRFAEQCRYVLNYDVFRVNEEVDNDWWFCNPEFLDYFFRSLAPAGEFVLFTHNSNDDTPIGRRFAGRLERPGLRAWFATNVALDHPKLISIPLGIANPIKVDPAILTSAQAERPPKTQLFEASFDIGTNAAERTYCLEQTGVALAEKQVLPEFFRRLASSYFCLSPNGNGIDCYRTWQALYLRTVPIVTRSLLTEQHPELPLIVLDDWSEFRAIEFSAELYERTWGNWDPAAIGFNRYLERVKTTLRAFD
jgi:putative hemolysin